ncbi:MAG TPA: NADH-quinone oxidoreductase subunit N [Pyrinomonadaceae bacterium]|jgi:NADH-quinone oxidoreductase subunit N|nr:NADH-quinone oxidoreductase subunit N [Pyrinomonadaceae bacterium]
MLSFLQANSTQLYSLGDLRLIAPEIILTVCACVVLVMEVILPYRKSKWTAYFALVGIGLATISLITLFIGMGGMQTLSSGSSLPALDGFYGMIRIDGFAILFKLIFLLAAALSIAISTKFLDIEGEQHGEYYALVLFATVGMMFLGCGYDLITLFISLELMALTFYVLVAFTKRQKRSNEAAMKYFLLGAFSSGILLYGMSLLYGVAGSTNLGVISQKVTQALTQTDALGAATTLPLRPLLLLGMIAMAAGLFFKIAAVPFHMWAPDAYEGAPTSVTAFLSTGSKAASFALFARIFMEALTGMRADWAPLLGLVAAITILVGNWAAVTQENSKRLLAYSSISNAGYLLLALISANYYGYVGLVIYLLVYTLMNLGAFGVIISLRRRGIIGDNVDDFTGLGKKSPGMAIMMTIFMLSLGGLPITGGFIGKWFIFGGLVQRGDAEHKSWYYWLAIWAVINTVVSFYYYVRFIRAMYLSDRVADERPLSLSPALKTSLVISLIGVIIIGIYPQPFIDIAQKLLAPLYAAVGSLALR